MANVKYDYIVEVEKFNPYHDSKGRFTTSNGATSFTYSPGKSKAHDNAIARQKMSQNPYRYATNEKIQQELDKARSERDTALRRSRMSGGDKYEKIRSVVAANKKKLTSLNEKIKLLEQAQDYFERYGNDNTF